MTELILISIGILASAICILDWRKGIYIIILAGFLQDPIRKIVEGEPVYLSILVGIFLVLAFLGIFLQRRYTRFNQIKVWNYGMRQPGILFILLVVIQVIIAYLNTSQFIIAFIGLIVYLLPFIPLLLTYNFTKNEEDIMKLLKIYLFLCTIMISGVYFSYFGFDWDILKSVGIGLIAFSPSGEPLTLHSGFMRAPEIAAWHAGAGVCTTILLFMASKRKRAFGWLAGILILFFIGASILTGRRKIIVAIMLFLTIYSFLLIYFRRGAVKLSLILLILGMSVAFISNTYIIPEEMKTGFYPYYERTISARESIVERLYGSTIGSFRWVIAKNGIFGSGAGVSSQGAQHFGGGSSIVGFAAEGGFGKILAELGIPGLTLFVWMAFIIWRYVWRFLKKMTYEDFLKVQLTYGLIAFLITNLVVFMTAHQVFGDLFVLTILSCFSGFVFAVIDKQESLPSAKYETNRM